MVSRSPNWQGVPDLVIERAKEIVEELSNEDITAKSQRDCRKGADNEEKTEDTQVR